VILAFSTEQLKKIEKYLRPASPNSRCTNVYQSEHSFFAQRPCNPWRGTPIPWATACFSAHRV